MENHRVNYTDTLIGMVLPYSCCLNDSKQTFKTDFYFYFSALVVVLSFQTVNVRKETPSDSDQQVIHLRRLSERVSLGNKY